MTRSPYTPLAVIFIGFPVWWLLGFGSLIFLLMSVPMAVFLWRRRQSIVVPRGFGAWLLFLGWVMLGAATLWADAPGAVPGGGPGRLLVFGWRAAWYLAATVVLLYIGNLSEKELPAQRIARLLGLMFVITTAGGLLALMFPDLRLTSALEFVLPGELTRNAFVRDAIHPKTADIAAIPGFEQARPTAPFAYSNTWGAAYAFFLPFFLISWLWRGSRWRVFIGFGVLAASLWPLIYSLNRGLWAALAISAIFVIARSVRSSRRTVWAAAGITAGIVMVAASGLFGTIQQRLETPHSDQRRTLLAERTAHAAVTGAPVTGFGSTREVQGNLVSVAGGDRPGCRACGAPPLGTQGHMWLLLFAHGLVGAAAFCFFFARRFARHWRDRSPYAIAGCSVLLSFALFTLVYDLVEVPLYTVMIAVALMWRTAREPTS